MLIRDIMKTNVITIPSSHSIAEAKKILNDNRILRLPVVDQGKLVGIITNRRLDKYLPSKISTLSVWELGYLLNKINVKEVMERNVLTCSPDTTAEEALALAQSHKVGAIIVLDDGKVVGISTTNDFFYGIINPLLGIGEDGCRIQVKGGGETVPMEKILNVINSQNIDVINVHVFQTSDEKNKDVVLHLSSKNAENAIDALQAKGFTVTLRQR
jgi:acetoin utilization protein AcuB